jgi:tricarballylate dehydrogenase
MEYDVLVVGAGNAAMCAAMAAAEKGAKVVVLECAPQEESAGNTRFTAGGIRFAYEGVDDLRRIMPDLTDSEVDMADFGSYSTDQFYDDMFKMTQYRTDPQLCEQLVMRSYSTMQWMQEKGVRFVPIYGRQTFKVDGKMKFWGGVTVESWGGGPGLADQQHEIAVNMGIEVRFGVRALSLITDGISVQGVRARAKNEIVDIKARSVVLASGGFEANTEWRARYLGVGWDAVRVRGTRFNTGDGIRMALDIGASPAGNWTGCHACEWDFNAPEFGDLSVGDGFQKHSYQVGIMVNARGRRFVDEGADMRNYTYAKYGRIILQQPDQYAWQVFDKNLLPHLRDEYRIKQVTKVTADSIEELGRKMQIDVPAFVAEVEAYNKAILTDRKFDLSVKDGRGTEGLEIPKSNWSNPIAEGPFEAYQVGCGITFTFGGLRIAPETAQVLNNDLEPISGLYAAGELVGGIFYYNYPSGTGLMSGAVFGKIAGENAASAA